MEARVELYEKFVSLKDLAFCTILCSVSVFVSYPMTPSEDVGITTGIAGAFVGFIAVPAMTEPKRVVRGIKRVKTGE